jgi:hypothetical protein
MEPCREIYPDHKTIYQYFKGAHYIKPLGWHKQLIENHSSDATDQIRHHLKDHQITASTLQLKGWAFSQSKPNQQLYLLAKYGDADHYAIPITQHKNQSGKRTLFKGQFPLNYQGKPLQAVRVGTPTKAVQIWKNPKTDG